MSYDAWKLATPDEYSEPSVSTAHLDTRPRVRFALPSGEVVRIIFDHDEIIPETATYQLADRTIVTARRVQPRPHSLALDLAELPGALASSFVSVLAAHDFAIVRASDTQYPLDGERLEQLKRELGNNAAHVVVCSDLSDDDQ